ncbi:MAG: cupin domain-containing protein [Acidobacteriaceae bacterium]
MDYTYFADLFREFDLPGKGILSRVLRKDDHVNVTAFGFSAGEEISTHSAPTPAILYFLEGEGEMQLGQDTVEVRAGSFVYMPPALPHGIIAKSPLRMLLVQIKGLPSAKP